LISTPQSYWHHPSALDNIETDAAQTKNYYIGSWLYLSGDHCADARRHTAANVANLVEGSILADFATAISGSTV